MKKLLFLPFLFCTMSTKPMDAASYWRMYGSHLLRGEMLTTYEQSSWGQYNAQQRLTQWIAQATDEQLRARMQELSEHEVTYRSFQRECAGKDDAIGAAHYKEQADSCASRRGQMQAELTRRAQS